MEADLLLRTKGADASDSRTVHTVCVADAVTTKMKIRGLLNPWSIFLDETSSEQYGASSVAKIGHK